MENNLEKISKSSSDEIGNFLNLQLKRYFGYKLSKKSSYSFRSITCINTATSHRIRPSSRDNLGHRLPQDCNPIRLSFNRTPQGKSNSYEIEVSLMIHNIFSKIGERYAGTHWVQNKGDRSFNKCVLIQVFLDCYVCDQNLMSYLMSPSIGIEWISSETFFKCFEQVQVGSLRNSFVSSKFIKLKNKSFYVQKMLCKGYLVFYSVVNFYTGEDLDRDNLAKALGMVEKRSKIYLENHVEKIMDRLAELHKHPMHSISFNDFYKIILELEL